jgi:Ca2+-binding EF-hand superfamily protein
MDTLGIDTSPEEIDLMIHEIDQDSNGEIDFDEFVAVMSRKVNATYTSDQVKSAFKAFEGNTIGARLHQSRQAAHRTDDVRRRSYLA